jgi:hypothetical protein
MSDGQVMKINGQHPFTGQALVGVLELGVIGHDHPGTIAISDTPIQHSSGSFTLDDASYVLTYDVIA